MPPQLAVVVASLVHSRSSLALGHVVASTISNNLGAFSLSLLAYRGGGPVRFGPSSRLYSVFLLVLITLAALAVYFLIYAIWLVYGSVLVVMFVAYLLRVRIAIGRGVLTVPENSDSDSDDTSSNGSGEVASLADSESLRPNSDALSETSPLLEARSRGRWKPLWHQVLHILGYLASCLAGYILS